MSRNIIFNTLVLLAVTVHVRSQYIDFFQSFSSFIQPYQTTRRADTITKRPTNKQSIKQNYQDTIFFETDDFIKQKETTTNKPRRKTTRKPTTKSPWFQATLNPASNDRNDNYYPNNQINNNGQNGNNNVYNNYETNAVKDTETTLRPIYNNNFGVAQKPISRPNNRRTTINPLLNRPGVRPAAVDENRPPITNRPVTVKPVSRPPINDEEAGIEIGPNEDNMSEAEKRRFIEIAEQKCEDYKTMNKRKIVALPLATIHATQGVELNVSTCTPSNIPLIIGGKVVSIQEFPHMSLVGWKNLQKEGYSWKCGGSLISKQYILTAGHCTYHDKDYNVISGPPSAVQLGSSYIDGRDAVVVSISSVIRHPKYKMRRSYYDVALLKLVTTIKFSESISPACLGVSPPVGDRIIATGWGRTEFGGDSSQELRSVSVSVWEMGKCREVWGTSLKLPEGPSSTSQLCAGEREGGKDTCQGDSGGPAQIQDGCSWRVVAVTSIGRSCGAAETPAIYAKLPRAFISAQVFSNVKLNIQNNNQNNRNNNQNNRNNNQNNQNNNWSDNRFNKAASNNQNNNRDEINRPGNHQTVGNNWGVTTQFSNQNFGSNRDVIRPGNHQTVRNNGAVTTNNNQFGNRQSDNRDEYINRPGNHQTIGNSNRGDEAVSNFFVTSHTTGNNREPVVSRPGNHQTIDNSNRDTNTGNNYFVTSHTSGNRGEYVRRLGNHQTIGNYNNNQDTSHNNNRFSDSQDSESNQDKVYNSHLNDGRDIYNTNNYEDNVRNTNTWTANNARTDNNYDNEHNSYYDQNTRNLRNRPVTYTTFGTQNSDYGTTESNVYNNNAYRNNNAYNENNNRQFGVVNRPWWNR